MATIHFSCPQCKAKLSAEPDQFGTDASCPECKWTFHVPRFEEKERLVKFFCPHCQRKLSATENQWGVEMPCPFEDCAKPVLIPHPAWKPVPTSILQQGAPQDPHKLVEQAREMTRSVHPPDES